MSFKKHFAVFIATTLMAFTHAALAANAVIDVLVVYSKGTADAYGGNPTTRINQLFQVTNQIYKDSNVNLEIRVAKTMMVNYTDDNSADTALNDITYAKNSAFSGVAAAREQAKADMVIFYRPFKSVQGSCGLAWIGGQSTNGDFSNPNIKKYMYSHTAINSCGDFVTAHELGHNMGLKHSRKQDGSGGAFPYALGYGVTNQFATIMAYQSEFNVDYWTGKLYKFSNPDVICKGVPCGVSRTDTVRGADASYALNITGPQIEKFYAAPASSVSSSKSSSSIASSKVSSLPKSSVASSKPNLVASSKASSALSSAKASSSSKPAVVLISSSSSKATTINSSGKSSAPAGVKASASSASSVTKQLVVEFNRVADVAQYISADWKNEIRREKGLTIDQAKAIAASNPKITYFFITKGGQMTLGSKGLFRKGDAVFFSGKPWYGSAKGMADAYERKF
ncbi:MAG: zinc-dependent metalloprotease [Cellvibrio sp.]